VAPKKKSRILELSDGSEDEDENIHQAALKKVDNKDTNGSINSDTDKEIEEPEESAEAELDQ
jgi:hypothetical protein